MISHWLVLPKKTNQIGFFKSEGFHFLGCWITFGLCEAPLSCVGIGFSWKALTASGGKAESSDVFAPDTTTDCNKLDYNEIWIN